MGETKFFELRGVYGRGDQPIMDLNPNMIALAEVVDSRIESSLEENLYWVELQITFSDGSKIQGEMLETKYKEIFKND